MARPSDILVIGGGVTGLSAGMAAAESGARVKLIDLGVHAGSTANAGSLHVQMQSRFLRLNPHLADNLESSLPLYRYAVGVWQALERKLGGVDLVREGGLMVAETTEQLDFLKHKAEREQKHGVKTEIVDAPKLREVAPYLDPSLAGAAFCRDEGKLNPLKANTKLRARFEGLGGLVVSDSIANVGPDVDGKPVAMGAEAYRADRIIIAAAWGAGALAAPYLPGLKTPGEPLHMNITEAADFAIHHLVQHAERSITLKQFKSGQVVIGGGWAAAMPKGRSMPKVLAESLVGNVALAAKLAPGLENLRIIRTWAGINTPIDGKAAIGPLPGHPNIHLALPGDAGYTLGPAVGMAAAALAMGEQPAFDTAPYSPQRFAE